MRQLGRGQSITFFVPAEIKAKITALRRRRAGAKMQVADVLAWSISETWHEARRLMPLWAAQGLLHQRQQVLWKAADKGDGYELGPETAARFLEKGGLTLRERYHPDGNGPCEEEEARWTINPEITSRSSEVARIQRRWRAFGVRGLRATALQQEQERELLAEREERPSTPLPPIQPLEPSTHADVDMFVRTGVIPHGSAAFIPALHALAGSSVTHILKDLAWPKGLLATADFARTVCPTDSTTSDVLDAYQRPVQWVATAPAQSGDSDAVAVVLSPWEANALMPAFRASGTAATLHLFAPRTNLVTRSADDLLLYTTPALPPGWLAPRDLMVALLLFAGQLYLRSYDEYAEICRFLGVPYRADLGHEGGLSRALEETGVFGPTATRFFLTLFKRIRYPSDDISATDLGHILTSDVLLPPSAFSKTMRTR
jgi:hypothetical protein